MGEWCRWRGSNSRPSVYKTAALPLCYTGSRYSAIRFGHCRRGVGAHYSARRAAHDSGALGVFTVLAASMYLTRHIDWFDVTFGKKADDGSRVQLHA